ncbi:MAG: AI-2E family transporter [candidate division KSB1 bacterium]|nr:AI-2E family transporter [candidate division KSB1 bacterium]MDZ7303277.1 AI-2E family transporter [candidate division KSB1 bacterium]MDZ7312581.1 AI-2E family transporter [candidate division KSB1 bacterium]
MPKTTRQYHLQFSDRHFAQVRRVAVAILLAAVTIALLVLLRDLITPVVIAIFLAYLLVPLVDAMENRGLPRTWAVIIVFLLLGLTVGLTVSLLWRNVVNEIQHLVAGVQIEDTQHLIERLKAKLRSALPGLAQSNLIDTIAQKSVEYGEFFISRTLEGLMGTFSAVGEMIIIPFLTFFMLKDARALKKNIVQRIPNRYFEMSLSLIHKATLQLGRFIRGQLLDATIVGIMAMTALSLLKLRYALLIGALAGMANMIPFLGPFVGGIPAVVVSIVDTGSFSGVIPIIVAFAVIKLIDDVIVQPTVVSKSVELHPVVVIISIFAGGHIGGILGMVVAVPLVSIIKETISILYWGFTKYYIFGPPPYAVPESGAMLEVMPATKAELPAVAPTPSQSPAAEIKKTMGPQTGTALKSTVMTSQTQPNSASQSVRKPSKS